jgi:OHCU decarboxylase
MNPYNLINFSKEKFLNTFYDLYEHSPWVIEEGYDKIKNDKKYEDIDEFHKLLSNIILEADTELQMKLIKSHPMLAGREAKEGELTDFSTNEQKSAGLNNCTKDEIKLFDRLNKEYFTKFDFPYILAVKGKNKEQIIENFSLRLKNSYESEKVEALTQINQIALIRIKDIYGK